MTKTTKFPKKKKKCRGAREKLWTETSCCETPPIHVHRRHHIVMSNTVAHRRHAASLSPRNQRAIASTHSVGTQQQLARCAWMHACSVGGVVVVVVLKVEMLRCMNERAVACFIFQRAASRRHFLFLLFSRTILQPRVKTVVFSGVFTNLVEQ